MTVNLDVVLENCLDRLAQGETLQACLARYPEYAAELEPMLAAAARLRNHAQVRPSPGFKTRARMQLRAHMNANPRKRAGFSLSSSLFRLSLSAAVLLLALATTGVALAQFSLPGDVLYPWKLSSEAVWRAISPDPVGVDLDLANRRIDEALAVPDDEAARVIALHGYQTVVTDLTKYKDPPTHSRIVEGLKNQGKRLKDAGVELPEKIDLPVSVP